MAAVKKFDRTAAVNQIRHIERATQNPGNKGIDPDRRCLDYSLTPDRGMSSYEYYKERLSELYAFDRQDVVALFGWIATAPADAAPEMEGLFFYTTFDFLNERYGEKNLVSCAVHKDEAGRGHLHYLSIPAVPDMKRGGEKACAKDVLNRRELRDFHPGLGRCLKGHGVQATVINGITKRQGGNRTAGQLKEATAQKQKQTASRWRKYSQKAKQSHKQEA